MRIDLWQIPLLVVAVLVVLYATAQLIGKRWQLTTERRKQAKTVSLGLLAAAMLVLLWRAWSLIGNSVMANVTAVVSTFIECGTLWLAYLAYRETIAAQAAKQAPNQPQETDQEEQT